MQAFLTLARRELGAYFLSMRGYVIIAAAAFLTGFSFVVLIEKLQLEPTPMPVTELFYITHFFWMILLLAAPVITMRLFAQEKFSGTFETLMTTPVSDLQVVLAKFSAALVFFLVMWLPLVGCLLVIRQYTNNASTFDLGAVGSTFIGIALIGSVVLSMGCFASAVTRSQVTAAMISLALGAGLFMLGYLADQPGLQPGWRSEVLSSFTVFRQMHEFARGIVDSRTVVLYLSFTFFFLFLTLRIVESRRWK